LVFWIGFNKIRKTVLPLIIQLNDILTNANSQTNKYDYNCDDLHMYSKIGLNNKHLAVCMYVIYTRKHNKQMQKTVIKYYRTYNNCEVKL